VLEKKSEDGNHFPNRADIKDSTLPKEVSRESRRSETHSPSSKGESQNLRFLVQEHHARRLHWDFRLELDGVLKSWAVPKGVPVEPGIKRLAVEVEDHPLSYYGFEGTIPEGDYGAGIVKVWDKGEYILELREPRKYHILLKGRKLKGDYRLINFKDKNWLIYKTAE
jgi:DNA ligase D-like protein (predicted 3'-phosphoesterase)